MTELEKFRMTRTIVAVPFGFNLFMVTYFLVLSLFVLLGGGPMSSGNPLWQLLTFMPPLSFLVNGLSLPMIFYGLRQDLRREAPASEVESVSGQDFMWSVFLVAGFVCTGMLYIFVFIPTILGMISGTI